MNCFLLETPLRQIEYLILDDVLERFAKMYSTMHDGEFLRLDAEDEAEIIFHLRKHGIVCIRDDNLVNRACGYYSEG